MTICERCGTENLDGSRYCDDCGAALWLASGAGKMNLESPHSNGSDGKPESEPELTVARSSGADSSSPLVLEQKAPESSGKPAHAALVIERGSSAGKQFPLREQDANIGRWDADGGVFPDVDLDSDDPEAKVSRRHARISLSDGKYLLEDLGSTNGTFINRGRRLAPGARQAIKDGDEIIVGKTFLRFRILK